MPGTKIFSCGGVHSVFRIMSYIANDQGPSYDSYATGSPKIGIHYQHIRGVADRPEYDTHLEHATSTVGVDDLLFIIAI